MNGSLLPTAEIEFKMNPHCENASDSSDHELCRRSINNADLLIPPTSGSVSLPPRPKTKKKMMVCEVAKLSAYDSKMVRRWRFISVVLALTLGATVSITGFSILRQSQHSYTQQSYEAVTVTLSESLSRKSYHLQMEARNMAELVTATAQATFQAFPNVTAPLWEVKGLQALEICDLDFLFWTPFVESRSVDEWNSYSNANQGGIDATRQVLDVAGKESSSEIIPFVYDMLEDGSLKPAATSPFMAPIWQGVPLPIQKVNLNILSLPPFLGVVEALSGQKDAQFLATTELSIFSGSKGGPPENNDPNIRVKPHSFMVQPVFSRSLVGMISLLVPWERYLKDMVKLDVRGIYCLLESSCGKVFTYYLNGNEVIYLGEGDFHDTRYDRTRSVIPFKPITRNNNDTDSLSKGVCDYSFVIYSSTNYQSGVSSDVPVIFATLAAAVAILTALAILQYDRFARHRNQVVETTAKQSTALLATLFPTNVAKRLFAEEKNRSLLSNKGRLKCYLDESDELIASKKKRKRIRHDTVIHRFIGKPIADFFPETTVLFADIAGFTSWSSKRQPEQVFRLLETVYRAFDMIAKSNRVYKVETIGDCYVAVTGLPDPRRDHAVAMARFAREIIAKLSALVKKLEGILGSDTAALKLRVGIHSGPVTGGVLRGDRSRFQLFGDTMNTASRMESTSQAGKVQLSQESTDLLIAAGKFHWIELRESTVVAKGKGEMQTYWLTLTDNGEAGSDNIGYQAHELEIEPTPEEQTAANAAERMDRLIGWNTECLLKVLRKVIAKRESVGVSSGRITTNERHFTRFGETVIDEVNEIVSLPPFHPCTSNNRLTLEDVELNSVVVDQMYDLVANIAGMYNPDNPFHNFEHASHVVMSVMKFLSFTEMQTDLDDGDDYRKAHMQHDHIGRIATDPLSHFACILGALIHDVDHKGVSNAQLIKEEAPIAEFYKGRCVQEQNALDLSWQVLMDDAYIDLRQVIYTNDDELQRFRKLVVLSVVTTDVIDEELKTLRNARWAKAFGKCACCEELLEDTMNRKATAVLELMVQASDVAHMMQGWHIYLKWCQHHFTESYKAYIQGRLEAHPADSWYHGELARFDFVAIPLAKKVKDSGVFGSSGDEYLTYALKNRAEWEDLGQEVVKEMVESTLRSFGV